MPAPHQPASASSAAKHAHFSDGSGESTPLLEPALPPPAYPDIVPLENSKDTTAGPSSRNQAEYDVGPSKDLEHLHHRQTRPWPQRKIFRLLLIALAHAVLIWLILTATWGRASKKGNVHHDLPNSEDDTPIPYYCQKLPHARITTHDFKAVDELRIVEQIRQHHEGLDDIHGFIRIEPANQSDAAADPKIRATVTISSNIPIDDDHHDISIVQTEESLLLQSTQSHISPNTWHDCTAIEVVVTVPAGFALDSLDVSANWLSLDLHPRLDLKIRDSFNVELGAGSVRAVNGPSPCKTGVPLLRSRRTYISPAHGSVSGTFALLDLLEITSGSGSIDVDVRPGEVDPDRPAPAVFNARSTTGSVNARFPTEGAAAEALPDRDYRVNVRTVAGSVLGRYVHGSRTAFETRYGSITVAALPWRPGEASSLSTRSESGASMLDLLSPLARKEEGEEAEEKKKIFEKLAATFTSEVGSVRAVFPREWEGAADLDTDVGSLRVDGEGLAVVEEGIHGPVGRWVKAVKGEGDSTVLVKSRVGSVEFLIR